MDKIIRTLGGLDALYRSEKPYDLCLVDFQTSEIYSLQQASRRAIIRDYYIDIDVFDEQIDVTAIYAPGGMLYKNIGEPQNVGKID